MKHIYLFSLSLILFIFSGCSSKVAVTGVKPAEISGIEKVKQIAVEPFRNDYIGFSSQLETKLSNINVYGKKYFEVVDRKNLNKILQEQKFQNSGMTKNSVAIGELSGTKALISGQIVNSSMTKNYYSEKRVKYDKRCDRNGKCKEVKRYYTVSCVKGIYNLSTNIKITNVETGTILFSDSLSSTRNDYDCGSGGLEPKSVVMEDLKNDILSSFIPKIAPTKFYTSVVLLEDPEVDYTSKDEELLEYSIEYTEQGRYSKAEQLLRQLISSTKEKDFVSFYNLGVIKETLGDYKSAQSLYQRADNLTIKPVEEINIAINRINRQINNKSIVKSQLGQ